MTKRKQYTKEFKLDAIRLVTEQGYKCAEVARNLGINANMLGRWIQEYRQSEDDTFRGNGKFTAEQEELQRLREENRRLKLEREVLKWRRPSSRKSRAEISVHCPREEGLFGEVALPSNGRDTQRFLRLFETPIARSRTGT